MGRAYIVLSSTMCMLLVGYLIYLHVWKCEVHYPQRCRIGSATVSARMVSPWHGLFSLRLQNSDTIVSYATRQTRCVFCNECLNDQRRPNMAILVCAQTYLCCSTMCIVDLGGITGCMIPRTISMFTPMTSNCSCRSAKI